MTDNMSAEQERRKNLASFIASIRFTLGSRLWLDQWNDDELAKIRNAIQPSFNDDLRARKMSTEREEINTNLFGTASVAVSESEPEPTT